MRHLSRRAALALHEATHATVAMKMGLTVAWVSIDQGYDEGVNFMAAVKIPDESIDMERDREAICVAMAAPSFVITDDEEMDRYARAEASLAFTVAGQHGIRPHEVYEEAARLAADLYPEIGDLADRLALEGRVVFERQSADGS